VILIEEKNQRARHVTKQCVENGPGNLLPTGPWEVIDVGSGGRRRRFEVLASLIRGARRQGARGQRRFIDTLCHLFSLFSRGRFARRRDPNHPTPRSRTALCRRCVEALQKLQEDRPVIGGNSYFVEDHARLKDSNLQRNRRNHAAGQDRGDAVDRRQIGGIRESDVDRLELFLERNRSHLLGDLRQEQSGCLARDPTQIGPGHRSALVKAGERS
jgi:hypothetical protein